MTKNKSNKKSISSFERIITIIAIIGTIWLGNNCLEIHCKRWNTNPEYSKTNVIVNVTNWAAEYHGLK